MTDKATELLGPAAPGTARQWRWSVMYETATIQSGTAPSRAEALVIAANVHDSYVIKGLNPDALAYFVGEVRP